MTYIFNMHDAKTKLSKLLELALMGETVQLARNGQPVAQIVPLESPSRPLLGEFIPLEIDLTADLLAQAISPEEWEQIQQQSDQELIQLLEDLANEKSTS
jgi:antitoxin (DNA-binding transcriptional repressor) of toxin-antitoxin stability system